MGLEQSVSRVEKKYDIDPVTAARLGQALKIALPADPNNGPSGYLVRSVYFDTIYDQDLADKEDGLEFRRKIRLRCYNPKAETVKLERKYKAGQYQVKQSIALPRADAQAMLSGDYNVLLRQNSDFGRELYVIMTSGLYRPRVMVEYRREAFMLPENDIRVTIDSHIGGSLSCFDLFCEHLALTPFLSPTVLEVKYNRFLLDYVKDVVNLADRTESAVSKYQLACRNSCC